MSKSNAEMIENDIETYFTKQVKLGGGLCFKFTSPSNRGVPDRVVIMNGHTVFVELKRPGGKPRKLQDIILKRIIKRGGDARVIDTKEQVDDFIRSLS